MYLTYLYIIFLISHIFFLMVVYIRIIINYHIYKEISSKIKVGDVYYTLLKTDNDDDIKNEMIILCIVNGFHTDIKSGNKKISVIYSDNDNCYVNEYDFVSIFKPWDNIIMDEDISKELMSIATHNYFQLPTTFYSP